MTHWQIYPTISASMPFQMALDEILFRQRVELHAQGHATVPLIRFYYASEPWVSLGYAYAGWKRFREGQPFSEDLSGLPSGIPLCRRLTGGGRVVHGEDLMFTVIAAKGADESFKSVRVSYWKLHEVLKNALTAMGEPAGFYRCDEELEHGKDCFLYPIATDLRVHQKKVAGGGQKRSEGMLLHQESVQVRRGFDYERLKEEFLKSFSAQFCAEIGQAEWDPLLFSGAEKMAQEKYLIESKLRAGT